MLILSHFSILKEIFAKFIRQYLCIEPLIHVRPLAALPVSGSESSSSPDEDVDQSSSSSSSLSSYSDSDSDADTDAALLLIDDGAAPMVDDPTLAGSLAMAAVLTHAHAPATTRGMGRAEERSERKRDSEWVENIWRARD